MVLMSLLLALVAPVAAQEASEPPAEPHSVYDDPRTGTITLLGGSLFGGGLTFHPADALYVDLTAGPRLGLSADPYANVALMAGVAGIFGQRGTRHGLFLRAGSTLPLDAWYELMLMGGYALRGRVDDNLGMGLDLGLGWIPVRQLPVSYEPTPAMLVLRMSLDIGS